MGKLTARSVATITKPGMHGDGAGLYLSVSASGSKSWILRTRVKGDKARREIGLGGVATLSLSDARKEAQRLRSEAKAGRDPKALRDARSMTFREAAEAYHGTIKKTFRSEKHGIIWINSLENHVFPKIGEMDLNAVERSQILEVLAPIWVEKHDTARRVKQRIGAVLDWAIGNGHFANANPVDGALIKALPKVKRRTEHHAALPWREVPQFVRELRARQAIAARCLEFAILTGVRSNEVRGANWNEIDFGEKTWLIPALRMKTGEEHRVPLSEEAIQVLQGVQGLDLGFIFPSPKRHNDASGRQLSVNCFRPLFDRMDRTGLTAHGFRSTFRDWAAESAHADRQVAEACLAHVVRGVEGAYLRSDFFERRRALMDAWGRHVAGSVGTVIQMVRA
ncbi:tyrosine-type recombinase/integrase [Pseudooceanicola sp.]|uniref:tyrosine-type recombinase/integrase n=1 Tax=Pseudooceanicola sp. TaxID=1914328 RepID=UPI0035C72816